MLSHRVQSAHYSVAKLESRRLLAAYTPDVAWGDAGFQSLQGPAYLSIPVSEGKVLVLERLSDYKGVRTTRLNPDGSTDTTYGTNGFGPTMNFNFVDVYQAMQQPDGKILFTGGDSLFVARFNADGTIDNGFGTNGIVRPNELADAAQPTFPIGGVAVQSDGKILATGRISMHVVDHNANFTAIYRFNPDGTLDTSFAEDGRLVVDIENVNPQVMTSLKDDRIFVAVSGGNLLRFNADGTPDTTFDEDGRADLQTMITDEDVRSVIELDNGKLLLGGSTYEWAGMPPHQWQSGVMMITRLNPNGSVDTTFGKDGFFHNNYGGGAPDWMETITAMTLDSEGRIFASGTRNQAKFSLYVLTPDGASDVNYMPGGQLHVAKEFYANDIDLLSDGKILVSGRGPQQTGTLVRVSVPESISLGRNGKLYLRGTEAADSISIQLQGSKVKARVNTEVQEFDASAVKSCEIEGLAGDDVIIVSIGIDAIVNPGAGNDSVVTSVGNDKITEPESGSGNDTIRSSDGNDTISAGSGKDRIVAGSGGMSIDAGWDDDNVTVGDGKMNIELSTGNDTLLTAMCDYSTINGNAGNDTITTFGSVTIFAGPTLRVMGWNPHLEDDDIVTATGGRIRVDLTGGNNTCTINSRFDATVGGGLGNDLIITGSGNDHIDPIGGNDTVYSNAGNDVIWNLGDNDLIESGSGDDLVNSGTRGKVAPCTVNGGGGNDAITLRGGGIVYAGSGNDTIDGRTYPGFPPDPSVSLIAYGHAGNDMLIGSDGRDWLYGGDGDDWIRGGMSADRLFGGAGNDKLSGNGGADILLGDVGIDTFFGNAGDDKLYCRDGEPDSADGGDGNDAYDADELDELSNVEIVLT